MYTLQCCLRVWWTCERKAKVASARTEEELLDLLNNEKGPFQVLFGDDASIDPNIIFPIVLVAFVVLMVIAFRIILKDKGRSEMTDEELEKDRALYDARMRQQAGFVGEDYDPAKARAAEAAEIAEAKRRYGKK